MRSQLPSNDKLLLSTQLYNVLVLIEVLMDDCKEINFDIDYYELLKVSHLATQSEIRTAYRKLARTQHRNSNNDDTEKAEEKFKSLLLAKEILTNERLKRAYDIKRGIIESGFWTRLVTQNKKATTYEEWIETCASDTTLSSEFVDSISERSPSQSGGKKSESWRDLQDGGPHAKVSKKFPNFLKFMRKKKESQINNFTENEQPHNKPRRRHSLDMGNDYELSEEERIENFLSKSKRKQKKENRLFRNLFAWKLKKRASI